MGLLGLLGLLGLSRYYVTVVPVVSDVPLPFPLRPLSLQFTQIVARKRRRHVRLAGQIGARPDDAAGQRARVDASRNIRREAVAAHQRVFRLDTETPS